jgi:non-heme chloroperoxidase
MPSSARLKKVAQTVEMLVWMLAIPVCAQDSLGQGFFTTSDKVKLHYLEAGQGKAILFIPGWLMPADIWEKQFLELSKDHHVVALDPRSQGQSDMTPAGNDPLRRSQDLQELLEHLHLDSVVLVGWSLGAFDAMAYLRQFGTGKVNALVLVDSPLAAPSSPAPAQRSPFLQGFQSDRQKAGQVYVWSLFKKDQSPGFYKKLIQSEARIPTDIALASLDNTQPGENWEPSLRILRQVPLLYAVTPKYASQAAYLQQVAPQARVELFENCGHALFVDEAERFNALIRDFLRQISLYPAGLPQSFPLAAAKTLPSAPSPIPTAGALAGSSPNPPAPFPSTAVRVKASPPPIPSPAPIEIHIEIPTAAATPLPPPPITVTPTQTVILAPAMTPAPNETPAPTSPSLTTRLSQTWNAIWGQTATPIPEETPSPTPYRPRPRPAAPGAAAPNPIQDGFFTTSDHVRLHYLEAGRGGQTLLFIPGWLLPAEIWKSQLEGLSGDYHVVALDPRSQGESDITPLGDEPLRQARDIQELLDHLHLSSVVLVGWSHGGFQVLAYMGEFGTDRLYATVLVDSALAAASSPSSTAQEARFQEQFKNDRPAATRGFVWGLFKRPPPIEFFRQLTQAAGRTPNDIALALLNNVFPGDSYQPSIPTIRQVPLLYAVTPKYTFQANYLTQVDPQARVEFFLDSGHALFVDEAEHFNASIRDFLRHSSLYPAGLPEPQHRQAGPVATHSYLENPK